jgi:hypothetical protein
MIKYLRNIFTKNNKKFEEQEKDIENYSQKIVFWTNEHGEQYVKIYIKNTELISAMNFGNMLYSINTGRFISQTLTILKSIGAENIDINTYILEVLENWKNSENFYVSKDTPYIKPTSFGQQA